VAQKEPGLLKTSLTFVRQALNENALLRTSVLATVLCITLACIGLAFFGVTYTLDPKGPTTYSPRLFALLFLPAEFLLYDLILGNPAPRASLKDLYLDWRFLRVFWAWIRMTFAVILPCLAAMLLLVAVTVGFGKGGKPTGMGVLVLVVGILAVVGAMFYLMFRFLYLNIVVARREPQPLKTSFRETRGKIWKISCALFLPWTAIVAVTIPVELLGPVLERNLGFVGLAPWFLLDAGLTGFLGCLGAAVLAFSYQRLIVAKAADEAQGAGFALAPTAPPGNPPGNPADSAGSGI